MTNLPVDIASRVALREDYLRAALLAVQVTANRQQRSMKCLGDLDVNGQGQHSWLPGGCANDGTGCLCFCHDRPVVPDKPRGPIGGRAA
jgi:hypothetical protein